MVKINYVSLDSPPILQTSEQAVPIPKIFGRARVAGQIIWADEFKIANPNKKHAQLGLGFSLSFAIALCEGEIDHISKVWANNQLIDLTDVNWRFYKGSADQTADPLLENQFGLGQTPAFRDVAYVVFEDLYLEPFGNLVPKFSFEVVNAIGELESQIKAVSIIPGATEFGYHNISIVRRKNFEHHPENQHGFSGKTDFVTSIDELCNLCPNLEHVSLIVPWFGDDLRADHIDIRPRIDNAQKNTFPEKWSVGGKNRGQTLAVSEVNGHAAFGGTPSDASVMAAIAEFKARGLKVTFYPFIMMDIEAANQLSNPYGGSAQPVYPWRGRITCDPAIGQLNSVDQTAAANLQIAEFFGDCVVADIGVTSTGLKYTGGGDWGYRRMILHYAKLCQISGGVDGFLLGSELVELMKVRDSRTTFPAVSQMKSLADDVRQVLASTKISYGADWSEYFGFHPADGTGDVLFHLDELWSHNNVDFIGIDAYWPLSDWRHEDAHLDKDGGVQNIYDRDYLAANITAGEGFDFYYADDADRNSQTRTPIDDVAYGKDWVFRTKDIKAWWSNSHYNRIDGVELISPTDWVAQSKPFWLTEIGCPAIDMGSNQPNVFYDPNSSESEIPYFAAQSRDDVIQRRYLEAFYGHYTEDDVANPISNLYGERMLEMSHAFVWAYDARPYPAFPLLTDVWADGENWNYGHWLNGRLGAVPLDQLILKFTKGVKTDVSAIYGQVDGYTVDQLASPVGILQDLLAHFGLVAFISDDVLIFKHQNNQPSVDLLGEQLLAQEAKLLLSDVTAEIPTDMHLKYYADDGNYSQKMTSELLDLREDEVRNDEQYQISATLSNHLASQIIRARLTRAQGENRLIDIKLATEISGLECGDVFKLESAYDAEQINGKWRILSTLHTSGGVSIKAISADANIAEFLIAETKGKIGDFETIVQQGQALVVAMNLPILPDNENADGKLMHLAAYTKPWLSKVNIYKDIGGSFVKKVELSNPAQMGHLLWDLYKGPVDRYDLGNRVRLKLYSGSLASVSADELLAGKNLAALCNEDGEWEVLQFKNAILTGINEYEISHFIRGRFGTEYAMKNPVNADASFVLLDERITALKLSNDEILNSLSVKFGPSSKPLEDMSYVSATWNHSAASLKPFAPVHVASQKINDDIMLSWVRQTRFGGENWELNQVALNEQSEAYEVEVWQIDGSVKLREFEVEAPNVSYSSAQQISDFGGLATSFKLKIYQMSAQYGRGIAKEVEIYV